MTSGSWEPVSHVTVPRGTGISTFMGLPHSRDLDELGAAVVGVPSDSGGTPGSRYAPRAIRDVSSLLRPVQSSQGIGPYQHLRVSDFGDVPVIPGSLHRTWDAMVETLSPFYSANKVPICLGGDHSITLGELRAAAATHGPVAMIQFDSHTDVYDVYYETERYNAGTMFRRAVEENVLDPHHSIMVGLRGAIYTTNDHQDARDLGFTVRTMDDVQERGLSQIQDDILNCVGDRPVLLTFDVDCLDPAYAPGTGTLEIGGFTTREALQIVRGLANVNFVGLDVVEVNPTLDPTRTTTIVGASMAFEFLCLLAMKRLMQSQG